MADSAEFNFVAQTPGGLKGRLFISNVSPDRDIPETMISITFTQTKGDAQVPHARLGYTDTQGKNRPAWNLRLFAYDDEEALGVAALFMAIGQAIEKEAPGWFKQPNRAVLVSEERWPPPSFTPEDDHHGQRKASALH